MITGNFEGDISFLYKDPAFPSLLEVDLGAYLLVVHEMFAEEVILLKLSKLILWESDLNWFVP